MKEEKFIKKINADLEKIQMEINKENKNIVLDCELEYDENSVATRKIIQIRPPIEKIIAKFELKNMK